jgi:hypothetical protein
MDDRRGRIEQQPSRRERNARGWRWQSVLAALLALLAVEGLPAGATYAKTGQVADARAATAQPATVQRAAASARPANASVKPEVVAAASPTGSPASRSADPRPDLSVSFGQLDEVQAGQPFSFTLRLHNAGGAAGEASVSAVLPPTLSNVRVTAPGFVCTRRFSASGPQAGTLVSCARNDLEHDGVAEVLVEANAPSAAGAIALTASADPRDDVAEADEANNEAAATVQVRA